jgi:hypothetical protein
MGRLRETKGHIMAVRILDLDGGLTAQKGLCRLHPSLTFLQDWGPQVRLACSHGAFVRFEQSLADRSGTPSDEAPILHFIGSGDFHHVTLALLRRLTGPFNLLVLDKHPDWMRHIPFIHCGTWLAHALQLPGLQRVFHLGGELDFDNSFRWLAPWQALRSGRIITLPAVRRFRGGAWEQIPHEPLRSHPEQMLTRARALRLLSPYREDLARYPLYISLDKDVMTVEDAVVNWDSGHLRLTEVETILETAQQLCRHQLAGMDIVGDWSAVRVQGLFRQFWHLTEHPALKVDPIEACRCNEATNLTLMARQAGMWLNPFVDAAAAAG